MGIKKRFGNSGILAAIVLSAFLLTGCGVFVRENAEQEYKLLTIGRLWQMHEDVNFVYFYYEDGSAQSGLLLRWDNENIKIQRKGSVSPEYIPLEGIVSLKVVIGNKIWKSLAAGTALAAGWFVLVGANDLGGESLASAAIKMLGAPLIIMASIAYGASSERTESYLVPENFEFDYDEMRRINRYTE